ncbi:AI-2E family transporter [Poseidonocella sedimentorum]|uniref:Predicted PurR-regulated permease PerM n=1 Tax=Poseidonocella sedimentorum TaxID=871652 RepID=A0A1I6DT31_9RHOB|nr:AI-2E family transporter [Poseidonocella sedimentorum]SFR08644.1 Predicted PurR-regulated permease PerM [Poseidonocella sedimentorum]
MQRFLQGQWPLLVLAALATAGALEYAAGLVAPIVLAFVCAVVLSPVAAFWKRCGLPNSFSALLSFFCALSLLGGLIFLAEPLVSDAYRQVPKIKNELREGMEQVRGVMRGISDMTEEVQKAIDPEAAEDAEKPAPIELPSLGDALFAAPAFAAQFLVFVGSLFFIMLSRDDVYEWLAANLRNTSAARTAACLRAADRRVSHYFLTISLINTCFGVLVAAALGAIGLPNPILWGFVAAGMNFILYLGPALVAVALLAAGLVAFEGWASLLPPVVFVTLNALEGQFITPTLVGRQVRVNPLLIFLSLCFWLWLWGPIGGFIAIPLLVWCVAVYDGLTGDQTIASGAPGTGRPNLRAGATR